MRPVSTPPSTRLQIELVLTAHPTEVLRRTLVLKYDAIGRTLAQQPRDVADTRAPDRRSVAQRRGAPRTPDAAGRSEVGLRRDRTFAVGSVAAVSAPVRREPRRVADARRWALSATPIRFATWMGGDRDGNPNVTATVTREVLMLARWMAADLYLRDVDALQGSLSMTHANAALLQRAQALARTVPRGAEGSARTAAAHARLGRRTEPGCRRPERTHIYFDVEDLHEPLAMCHRSLHECGMGLIADGPLLDTLRRVAAFGTTLVRLDVRQSSDRHTLVLDEITQYLGILRDGRSYAEWSEKRTPGFLLAELVGRRPLFPASVARLQRQPRGARHLRGDRITAR